MEPRIIKVNANPKYNKVNLDSEYDSTKRQFFVRAGGFRVGGQDYILPEDEVVDVPDAGCDTDINIILVQMPDESIRVLFDVVNKTDPELNLRQNKIKKFATIAVLKFKTNTYTEPEVIIYKCDSFDEPEELTSPPKPVVQPE